MFDNDSHINNSYISYTWVCFSLKENMLRYPVIVDGHFLTKPVDELNKNHELLKIPFITGVNNHEGGWILPMVSTCDNIFDTVAFD